MRTAPGFALALLVAASSGQAQEPGTPFKVVVHAGVAGSVAKRALAADMFLRKVERWGDGAAIRPVDQSATSPIRAIFSKQVLGQPTVAVQNYWQRMILTTRAVPPPVKSSDAEVLAFVRSTRGGIGYVSEDAALPDGVKVLRVEE